MLKLIQIRLKNVTFLDKCQHELGAFANANEMLPPPPPGIHCHNFANISDVNCAC